MSSASARWCVAAGLLLAAAPALPGQTPEEQAHIARLTRRYEERSAHLEQAIERAAPLVDSIRIGPLWILSDSVASARLRDAAATLDRMLRDELGGVTVIGSAAPKIIVRFAAPSISWGRLIAGDAQFVALPFGASTAQLARQLAHAVQTILGLRAGASFAAWGADLRLFADQQPLFEATNVELRTASVPGATECLEGRLDACARALNLPSSAGDLDAAADIRRFVTLRLSHRSAEPALAESYAACVHQEDDDACLRFLERAGVAEPALSARARGTLLITMRVLGGTDAFARFFADTGAAIVPRLEAGAGAPLDSLLGTWRTAVLAQHPPPPTLTATTQWLVFAWVVAFAAMATRSTRWR